MHPDWTQRYPAETPPTNTLPAIGSLHKYSLGYDASERPLIDLAVTNRPAQVTCPRQLGP